MSIFMPPKTKEYSVVDPIQDKLDEGLIENNKIKKNVSDKIANVVDKISKELNVKVERIYLVGSSLTFQYKPDSDIDVTIFVNKEEDELLDLNKITNDRFNEKLFINEHPVNFHFNSGKYYKFKADAIYDLKKDKWIKKPEAMSEDDVEDIIRGCQNVKEFNEILQEYTKLKKLLEGYSGESEYLEEILQQSFKVSNLFHKIKDIRREDFKKRDKEGLPSANFRCSNIIFKLLEQYGLNDLAKQISIFLNSRAKN
jgi:predicted nucleotidyltransferase